MQTVNSNYSALLCCNRMLRGKVLAGHELGGRHPLPLWNCIKVQRE